VFGNYNTIRTHDLNSMTSKPTNSTITLKAFPKECTFWDLKIEYVITEYVKKIQAVVNTIFKENPTWKKNDLKFSQFWEIFRKGNYGEIASDLADSEDYVKSYFNYFKNEHTFKMTIFELTQFMGLYFLEGELLVENKHPYLSHFFPNEHEVNDKIACEVTTAFWMVINRYLRNIYVSFNWGDNTLITKREIFQILIQTKTGKCLLISDKLCRFFDNFVSKAFGFFSMKSGKKKGLSVEENKLLFSSFLFRDISVTSCSEKDIDKNKLLAKYNYFLDNQFRN